MRDQMWEHLKFLQNSHCIVIIDELHEATMFLKKRMAYEL
jgi:hypothetical protein